MRTLAFCTLLLATTACVKIDDPLDTLTSLTAVLTDSTTDATASGGTTAENPTGGTTAENPTTGSSESNSGTTTSPTTGDPSGTTSAGSTGGGSTGGGTTGGASDYPYPDCSNAMGMEVACPMGSICIDDVNTMGQVTGAFCSPTCSGAGKNCPTPDGVAGVQGQCLFGADAMNPTNCALICNLAMDTCPEGSKCEDIGIPEQMGMMFGICTFP